MSKQAPTLAVLPMDHLSEFFLSMPEHEYKEINEIVKRMNDKTSTPKDERRFIELISKNSAGE